MSWLKVDDRAFDDPRFGRVSRDARLMHVEALAYSMGGDGTGVVTRYGLRRATDAEDPESLAGQLVAEGLWTVAPDIDGWQIVFMLDDQLSPDEITRQREFNRARQARNRRHQKGDHSLCDPRFCNAVRNAVTSNAVTVPRPDPTKGGSRSSSRSARSASASLASLDEVVPAYLEPDFENRDEAVFEEQDNTMLCAVCGETGQWDEHDPGRVWVNATMQERPDEPGVHVFKQVHVRCSTHPMVVEVEDEG
jgi:hypothetical protein